MDIHNVLEFFLERNFNTIKRAFALKVHAL